MNSLTLKYILILALVTHIILPHKLDLSQFPLLTKVPSIQAQINQLENAKDETSKKQLLRQIRVKIKKSYRASQKSDKDVANLKKALDEYTKIKAALDIKTKKQA